MQNKILKSLTLLILGIVIGSTYHDEIDFVIKHQLEPKSNIEITDSNNNSNNNNSLKDQNAGTTSPKIDLCFTPPVNCAHQITNIIDQSKSTIYMQAYGLTHPKIISSLIKAKQRGVWVRVLLDRSNLSTKHSKIKDLEQAGIKVTIDNVAGIAHNKVIIVDKHITVTGSFNFTVAADTRNVENVLIIEDEQVAHSYLQNWLARYIINQGQVLKNDKKPRRE